MIRPIFQNHSAHAASCSLLDLSTASAAFLIASHTASKPFLLISLWSSSLAESVSSDPSRRVDRNQRSPASVAA